jgi:acetyl esterase/lipase
VNRFLRRYWLALLVPCLALSLAAALWLTPAWRQALRTALLYPQVLVPLPGPLQALAGPDPQVETVVLQAGQPPESFEADIYRPPGGAPRGALLVVIGAAPAARRDPRAVRLAEGVARSGIVVMVPVLPRLSRKVLSPEDVEVVVQSFLYLRSRPYVDAERVAVLGFSVGEGIALAAAADPRIRQQVVALGSFGGYYDVRELIVAVATDTLLVDGQRQPWQPDPWAKEVLKSSLLYFVPDRRERDLLAAALDTGGRLPSAALSPTASLVQAVLLERDPQRAHQLLAQAPPELARTLDLLSPRTYTAQVQTEVFIVADRHDPLVPYSQSALLRDDLRAQGKQVRYAEIAIFRHVNPRLERDPASFLADFVRLFLQTYALLGRLR